MNNFDRVLIIIGGTGAERDFEIPATLVLLQRWHHYRIIGANPVLSFYLSNRRIKYNLSHRNETLRREFARSPRGGKEGREGGHIRRIYRGVAGGVLITVYG